MSAKPAGTVVTLTDLEPGELAAGDVVETTTGRRYLLLEAHPSGKRVRYDALVMAAGDPIPDGATVHGWEWARR